MNVFTASSGLNTKVDPVRLRFSEEAQELAVAYNVEHDYTGRVSRRKGFEETSVQIPCHSLFCDGGDCFFVSGSTLYRLNADHSTTSVATVSQDRRVAYVQLQGKTYWMNGVQKGVIENGVNSEWVKGVYHGPDTERVLFDPPVGTNLAYHGGKFYVTQGNVVWYSDPYDLNAFDLARSFYPFQYEVRMFHPLFGGIWASDEQAVYFISEEAKIKKADYPAIEFTDHKLDMEKLPETPPGVGVIFTTTQGICVGLQTGEFFNLTHRKFDYPLSNEGCSILMGDRYITILKP